MWLSGRTHELNSAAALAEGGKILWHHVATARLTMRAFSDTFLSHYLEQTHQSVVASTGVYQIEGLGAQLFEHIEGDHFTILGMPLLPLLAELRARKVMMT
jgi:septum formation protein